MIRIMYYRVHAQDYVYWIQCICHTFSFKVILNFIPFVFGCAMHVCSGIYIYKININLVGLYILLSFILVGIKIIVGGKYDKLKVKLA